MAKAIINLQKESGGITKISSADGTGVTELVVPESGNLVSVDTTVTDNSIARYDGTTGKLQNSGVVIDDSGNITASTIKSTEGGSEAFSIRYVEGQKPNVISSVRSSSTWSFGFGVKPSSIVAGEFISTVDNTAWTRGALLVDETLKFLKAQAQNTAIGSTVSMTEVFRTTSSGDLLLTSGIGALGYGPGAGGTVTQLTSKSTAVTLNKPSGVIVTHSESIAAGASVTFQVLNSLVTVGDLIFVCMSNDSGAEVYSAESRWVSNGSFYITLTNHLTDTLSGQLSIKFVIIKGSNT